MTNNDKLTIILILVVNLTLGANFHLANAQLTTPTPTPPPTIAGLPATSDPELQRIAQIANDCHATIQKMHPGATTVDSVILKRPAATTTAQDYVKLEQCNQLLRQAIAQYCNILTTYDAAKCSYVNTPIITNLINMSYTIANQQILSNNQDMSKQRVQDAINNYLDRLG